MNNTSNRVGRAPMLHTDIQRLEQRFERCGARLTTFSLWRFENFNDEELTWLMKAEQAGRDRPRPEDKRRRVRPPQAMD